MESLHGSTTSTGSHHSGARKKGLPNGFTDFMGGYKNNPQDTSSTTTSTSSSLLSTVSGAGGDKTLSVLPPATAAAPSSTTVGGGGGGGISSVQDEFRALFPNVNISFGGNAGVSQLCFTSCMSLIIN